MNQEHLKATVESKDQFNQPCTICFEPYELKSATNNGPARYPIQLLPCKHILCAKCVAYHRTTNTKKVGFKCPYCRVDIQTQEIHPNIEAKKTTHETDNDSCIIRKFAIQREIQKTEKKLFEIIRERGDTAANLQSLIEEKNSLLSQLKILEERENTLVINLKSLNSSEKTLKETLALHQQTLNSVADRSIVPEQDDFGTAA